MLKEAFSHLSAALTINGFTMSKQNDTLVIKPARQIARDWLEVGTERPSLTPERMYTWVCAVKNINADDINKELRKLASKDGELNVNSSTNQIVFTDWVKTELICDSQNTLFFELLTCQQRLLSLIV